LFIHSNESYEEFRGKNQQLSLNIQVSYFLHFPAHVVLFSTESEFNAKSAQKNENEILLNVMLYFYIFSLFSFSFRHDATNENLFKTILCDKEKLLKRRELTKYSKIGKRNGEKSGSLNIFYLFCL
jgi:hypothetical protein